MVPEEANFFLFAEARLSVLLRILQSEVLPFLTLSI